MKTTYFTDVDSLEEKATEILKIYEDDPNIKEIKIFPDFHYSSEKAVPVGTAFSSNKVYPLIMGKDVGCGVSYIKISKKYLLKPFNKSVHYKALYDSHLRMTDDGLGGGRVSCLPV